MHSIRITLYTAVRSTTNSINGLTGAGSKYISYLVQKFNINNSVAFKLQINISDIRQQSFNNRLSTPLPWHHTQHNPYAAARGCYFTDIRYHQFFIFFNF